jgi:hypothetical protein
MSEDTHVDVDGVGTAIGMEGNLFDSDACITETVLCDLDKIDIVAIEISNQPMIVEFTDLPEDSMKGPYPTAEGGIIMIGPLGEYMYIYRNGDPTIDETPIAKDVITFVITDDGDLYEYKVTLFQMTEGYIDKYGAIPPSVEINQLTSMLDVDDSIQMMDIRDILEDDILFDGEPIVNHESDTGRVFDFYDMPFFVNVDTGYDNGN